MIDLSTRIVALVCGIALLVFIVELVRRRKLKEEYSVLWVITAVAMLVLSVWFESLEWITDRIGGVAPSSTLFFLGLLFVFFMLLHFSLRVSALERRLMSLVQEIGLMSVRSADPDTDPPDPPAPRTEPRTAVVIPCFNDGEMAAEAVASVREEEPIEIVVVDDGSTEPDTLERLALLERDGIRVLRCVNSGPAAARTAGLAATSTPFVFVLDADDLVEPGALAAMADLLEGNPDAGFVWGDYVLFGDQTGSYRAPERWLPWTLTYVNPYPVCSMFRREVLERADGWHGRANAAYEDWDLWLRLVGLGIEGCSARQVVYRRRLHGDGRHLTQLRARHQELYAELKERNAAVFARRDDLRRREGPSAWKRAVYPVLFGSRRVVPIRVEAALQRTMMSMGTGLPR
jgi:glycosyltransferase involved in cell wall biosynthesis